MKNDNIKIFVECYTDEFFIKEIVKEFHISHKIVKHATNRPGVYDAVMKNNKSLGMVDKDPDKTQSKEGNNYKEIKKQAIFTLQQRNGNENQSVIQLDPDIENCFLAIAKKLKFNLASYKLIDDPDYLHKIDVGRNKDYQRFIIDLIKSSDEIQELKKWIIDYIHS